MELYYDFDNYIQRLNTPLCDDKGRLLYYGIYDFSYKYRTRIFDADDNEIAYVEKDISSQKPCVRAFSNQRKPLFELYLEDDLYRVEPQGYSFRKDGNSFVIDDVMTADERKVVCEDVPFSLSLLFAMVEITR